MIWSKNRDSGRIVPDGGRHPTKNHKTGSEDINLLRRFRRKWVLLIRSVGLNKKIIDIFVTALTNEFLVIQETQRNAIN